MNKILLVDDEADILDFLSYNLAKEGFEVFVANNGSEAIVMAALHKPDLIILDIMMPILNGIETCRKIKEIPDLKNVLIAFLTARDSDSSQIEALDVGGDDFIAKPIKPQVLVSRVKALLRRREKPSDKDIENILKIADLEIDYLRFVVKKKDIVVELPKKEFELLALLVSRPGKVFTRSEIYSKIWGNQVIVGDRTIDVHIRKLREKLGAENIRTLKGIGYKFDF
jgi:two-component system, OmpR family, alkaline phosphatase synthesis response regulator PhoP